MANTTKISKTEWEIGQLVMLRLSPDKGDERHSQAVFRSALRALFQAQPEVRTQMVIRAYTADEMSIGKAAEIMGVDGEEMKGILTEGGAEIHLSPRTADDVLRDTEDA